MAICFEGQRFELRADETVLEGIERHGSSLPAFCRRGVCQACLVRAKSGAVPAAAQRGLKDGLRQQSLFLACLCQPSGDLEVERIDGGAAWATRVERVERLSEQVLRVLLTAPDGFSHRAGQFIQLERSDGLMRAYSIASLPGGPLELHVERLPGGAMSRWVETATGAPLTLRGPFGECFYLPDEPERPLCLAGTGTGLAPLLGVLRAAIAARHRGPIQLHHGSRQRGGLYLWAELEALARDAPQLELAGSVLEEPARSEPGEGDERIAVRRLDDALLGSNVAWSEARVYLCGNYDFVRRLQKRAYLAGASLARIHADAFVAPGARVAPGAQA
ncbi:MAG TPA: 2Fe-2S iron-sulfur cluster binding domain-containing protein [Polyangiaceae bacterium]|nr:2Fe-2S iron-sulfur cluster binding domain-containing protein [Polyangiaceae bacterium]